MSEIALGSKVKHKYSPYTGIVTGTAQYVDFPDQVRVTVQDEVGDNGKPIEDWFPETSVDVLS